MRHDGEMQPHLAREPYGWRSGGLGDQEGSIAREMGALDKDQALLSISLFGAKLRIDTYPPQNQDRSSLSHNTGIGLKGPKPISD